MTTSQMNVQVATKNGYLLKKSSIASKIDSKSILPEAVSVEETAVSEARLGREVKRSITVKESWVFVNVWRRFNLVEAELVKVGMKMESEAI